MTVSLKNVDLNFLEMLKTLVNKSEDIKMYESCDEVYANLDGKKIDTSFIDDVEVWRNEFNVYDDSVADFFENVYSSETPNFEKATDIWK